MTYEQALRLALSSDPAALAAFLMDINNGESPELVAQLLNARILYHDEHRSHSA